MCRITQSLSLMFVCILIYFPLLLFCFQSKKIVFIETWAIQIEYMFELFKCTSHTDVLASNRKKREGLLCPLYLASIAIFINSINFQFNLWVGSNQIIFRKQCHTIIFLRFIYHLSAQISLFIDCKNPEIIIPCCWCSLNQKAYSSLEE